MSDVKRLEVLFYCGLQLVNLEHRSELLAQAEEERQEAVRVSALKEAEIGRLREQVLVRKDCTSAALCKPVGTRAVF
jgi:hypothetical protein